MQLVFLALVDWVVPGNPHIDFASLQDDPEALAYSSGVITSHLAAFHTLFNILNTALLVPFVAQIEKLVRRWVKDAQEPSDVRYISTALIETPELLVVQVAKEMQHMLELTQHMFRDSLHILTHPQDKLGTLVENTLEREDIVDHLDAEIAKVLALTARAATSATASRKIAELLQNTHRIERIADHCAVLVRIARRMHNREPGLGDDNVGKIEKLGNAVAEAMDNLRKYLAEDRAERVQRAEELETAIDDVRRTLRESEIEELKSGSEDIETGIAVLDVLTHLEEIGDRIASIVRTTDRTHTL
jgi:phosphate:Na+ symporter